MITKFIPQALRMSAAGPEAGPGSGAGGSQQSSGQQAGATQTPATSPATPAPVSNGGDAPVTRAEFQALMSKIEALGQPPKAEPSKQPDAPKADDMPEWAKALNSKLDGLTAQQKAQQVAARKQQLVSAALDGVPDVNRGLAALALEGLLASTGVNLDAESVDVNALAQQLGTTLRTQHAALFTAPGSRLTAIPKTPDGKFDWSQVHSLADVPPGMMKDIPDAATYQRLVNGVGAGGSVRMPDGKLSILPRNRMH